MKISATVKRGKKMGTMLSPHRHKDGTYVVSKTRYEKDYIRLGRLEDILPYVQQGYGVRMSNRDGGISSASLICCEALVAED